MFKLIKLNKPSTKATFLINLGSFFFFIDSISKLSKSDFMDQFVVAMPHS